MKPKAYQPPPMAYMPNQNLSKAIQHATRLNQPQAPMERPKAVDCGCNDPKPGGTHPSVSRG